MVSVQKKLCTPQPQPEQKVSKMKKFRDLMKETRVEDDNLLSNAARTLKEKPNKEPMPKLKEETDTTEKVEMTQSQLHFIHYACEEILDYIDDGGEVEEWYQVKVAKAFSEFESMHSFIEGEKRRTGMVKEEQLNELDKEPGGTLHRYLASPKQRQRRIQAAIENPDKLKKINKGMRSAETKIEKERQKQTGMNPQYQPPPPTPRQIQKMDLRYTHEQTESVPASKALQKTHDDERKKRGLPDPSYYLELMKKKKKEIEDMKKEEVNLDEKITVMPAGTPNTGIQRVKLPSGGTITTGSIARGSTTRPAPSPMIANRKKPMAKEEVESLEEKNVPTSPEKWAQAKAQAKAKFDVYPSAYANGWAAKKYKEMGGGWKSVSEETELDEGYYKSQETERQETKRLSKKDDLPFTPDKPRKPSVVVGKKPEGYSIARHLARQAMQKQIQKMNKPVKEETMSKKAKIVKNALKKTSKDDQFQAEPMLSQSIVKNN
jgi:hypothetical protein